MSAVPRLPSSWGYAGLRMTADQYLALGETPERYELVDGVVVMSPSPTPRHQRVALLFAMQMEECAEEVGGIQIVPDVDVRMSSDKVYRPDIVVYGKGRLRGLPDRLSTPPDLVVEVLSPGSEAFDLVTKLDDYGRFGVREYWVVDPVDVSVRCWRRSGAKLAKARAQMGAIACASVRGLAVDLGRVRRSLGR